MNKYSLLKELTLLGLAIIVAIIALPGCGGDSTPVGPGDSENDYQFIGSLIKDMNLNKFVMVADINRNDTTVTDAEIIVSGDTLIYNGSYYILTINSSNHLTSGIKSYVLIDSDRLSDTITVVLPANLVITSVLPTVKDPSDLVNVQWTGAAGAAGYIIATVKRDSTYINKGFSQFVTSQTTSATIENEAFLVNNLSGGDANPGTYDIFVYAYWGIPDSNMTSNLLPVPVPGQLLDNINEQNITGSVGAVVISQANSVEVVAE